MPPTTAVLTAPEPGTVIRPIHTYSEEQAAQIEALREVGNLAAWTYDGTKYRIVWCG